MRKIPFVNVSIFLLFQIILGHNKYNECGADEPNDKELSRSKVLFSFSFTSSAVIYHSSTYITKVRPNQIWQDRALNLFAICLAYESSASLKVKCYQVWPIIII